MLLGLLILQECNVNVKTLFVWQTMDICFERGPNYVWFVQPIYVPTCSCLPVTMCQLRHKYVMTESRYEPSSYAVRCIELSGH